MDDPRYTPGGGPGGGPGPRSCKLQNKGDVGGGPGPADIKGTRGRSPSHGPAADQPEIGLGEPESTHYWNLPGRVNPCSSYWSVRPSRLGWVRCSVAGVLAQSVFIALAMALRGLLLHQLEVFPREIRFKAMLPPYEQSADPVSSAVNLPAVAAATGTSVGMKRRAPDHDQQGLQCRADLNHVPTVYLSASVNLQVHMCMY